MIFDGFTFFNEIELLELRLEIMWDYVDRFIIVESRKTFTNVDKELNYKKNRERFKKFWNKIEYVVIDEFPSDCKNAWDCEHYQRNAIYRGVKSAKPDDILIVSDLDEIISPYGLKRIKNILTKNPEKLLRLELLQSWYFFNYVDQKSLFLAAPIAYTIGEAEKKHEKCLGTYPLDKNGYILPQTARSWSVCMKVPCAGWHFSYMGGVEKIKKKIRAFSHQEYNTEEWLDDERIINMIESGKDLFNRDTGDFVSIPLSDFMPEQIKTNPEKYKDMLCDYRPISHKKYLKLKIKYLFETTWLRNIYRVLRQIKL